MVHHMPAVNHGSLEWWGSHARLLGLATATALSVLGTLGCASTDRAVPLEGDRTARPKGIPTLTPLQREAVMLYVAEWGGLALTALHKIGLAGVDRIAVASPEWETSVIAPDTPSIRYPSGRDGFIAQQEASASDSAKKWSEMLCMAFNEAGVTVVARGNDDIQRTLQEHDFQATFSSGEAQMKVGRLLGVDAMVIPRGTNRTRMSSDGTHVRTFYQSSHGVKILDVRNGRVLLDRSVGRSTFRDLKADGWRPTGQELACLALADKTLFKKVIKNLPQDYLSDGLSSVCLAELHLAKKLAPLAEFYDPDRARYFIEQAERTDAPEGLVAYLWTLYYFNTGNTEKFEEAGARMIELMKRFPRWYARKLVLGSDLPKHLTDQF